MRIWIILMLAIVSPILNFAQANQEGLQLHISPAERLLTDSAKVIITGAPPGAEITLLATLKDNGGQTWSSRAIYYANRDGSVDLSKDASLAGTYQGVDNEGIFWSMQPATLEELGNMGMSEQNIDHPRRIPDFDSWNAAYSTFKNGVDIVFKAKITGAVASSFPKVVIGKQHIQWVKRGVKRIEIKEGGLRGVLYEAGGEGPQPIALVVTGSGGGAYENKAAVLASNGITAFALAHFNYSDRPKELKNIPLEYFESALDWLSKRYDLERIALFGDSRGGEGVLLIASTFPDKVSVVVAGVPSNVVWSGYYGVPSWTLENQALPHIPWDFKLRESDISPNSMEARDLFLKGMTSYDFDDPHWIPVEKIQSPILLVSGDADAIWPSSIASEKIVERLKKRRFNFPVEHLEYKGAGHQVTFPMLVKGRLTQMEEKNNISLTLGGTPQGNARAQTDAFQRILSFIKHYAKTNSSVNE
ncbi:acyl-CoA thioesterase/bile acid-CoA:amino acid N-acyltransferase family protein [Croceitalea dokdonensis]|nr:acyl-CoA thioesterase/bile acid-CoA:amino acid N-acyltransferase family protein [Croceitalea dokdonensis]